MVAMSFENDCEFNEMEQWIETIDHDCHLIFVDQQEVYVHVSDDPLANLLKSLVKANFADFMSYGNKLIEHVEFSF